MSEMDFDEESYVALKRSQFWQSWGFLLFGGLVLLDSGSPLPIPLVGLPSIVLGGTLFAYGWMQSRSYHKLPMREAVQIGKAKGQITRTELFLKLHLTTEQTDKLLDQLIEEGFIEALNDELPEEAEITYRVFP